MNAYSRLKRLLKQQRMSIPELHRRIDAQGLHVNVKSLYRLSDDTHPVDRLDMHVAGAICKVCEIPLSEWIVFEDDAGELQKLAPNKQARLDALMSRNNEEPVKDKDRLELQALVREAEEIMLANARILARRRHRLDAGPVGGVSAP